MYFEEFYDLHDCMDSKCPIEKLDESVKKGFQIDADRRANQNHFSANKRGNIILKTRSSQIQIRL